MKVKHIVGLEKLTDKKFLNMYEGTYELKDGSTTKWDFASRKPLANPGEVSRVTKERRADAVSIACFYYDSDHNRHFLLIKEYRSPFDDYLVSFPAGLIENGETPTKAAIREVSEEIGAKVKNASILVPFAPTSAGVSNECNCIVVAEIYPDLGKQSLERSEDITPMDLTASQAQTMLDEGKEIVEMPTALVLRYLLA